MMNEEAMKKEASRAVRFNKIALAALALLAVVGVWALLSWLSRPLDQNITPDILAENLSVDQALGKTGGVYYVLSDTDGLVDALSLPDWTITQDTAEEEPLAVFRLGEDYQLALYEGDLARVWNGYAPSDTTDTAWYTMPEGTSAAVAALLKTAGQVETDPPERF